MLFAIIICHDCRGKVVPLVLKSVKSLRSSLCKVEANSDAAHLQSKCMASAFAKSVPCVKAIRPDLFLT